MRIAELSRESGVSVASIKFYQREGLLAAGEPTAANRSTYGEHHLVRLRLIRSLIDIGGLSIAKVRAVLGAVDDESTSLHDAFGAVMRGLGSAERAGSADAAPDRSTADAITEIRRWLRTRSWMVEADAPAIRALAGLMVTVRRFGFPISIEDLDASADTAERNAEFEVAYARSQQQRTAAVETMLVGTVVLERAFTEIRRLALEAVSARVDREFAASSRTRR